VISGLTANGENLMYENREFQPLSSADFLRRLLTHFALSAGMLVFSILLGHAGLLAV
jgi:hypothetical protein